LKESTFRRERIIIDIKLPEKPETVKHIIRQYWCGTCKEMKEKAIIDALPGYTIGLKTTLYSAYQHYHLGMSISKVIDTLSLHGLTITPGALVGSWHTLAKTFKPFYNSIHETIKNSTEAVHADETGARQKGKKFWLWAFSTKTEVLFAIRKSRGGDVVREILGDVFMGILVTDFWKPYLAVKALFRQWCVAHFLREFKKIEYSRKDPSKEYWRFKKKVKRLFHDALRLSKKDHRTMPDRQAAYNRYLKRLDEIVAGSYCDQDVLRLVKRLRTYRDGFFTFVVKDVDSTNNHAERIIRYAVIMRKISFHTMSDQGSETMSVLMSVFKTLELRNKNVFREALSMTQDYILIQKSSKKNSAA
jgi:transposase